MLRSSLSLRLWPLCIDDFDVKSKRVSEFGKIALSTEERVWLVKACPYFKPSYLDYLEAYRFNPEQLDLRFEPIPEDVEKDKECDPSARGLITIHATGPWQETILWEVPLMACLSEIYFTTVDTDWDYQGQKGMDPSCLTNAFS